MDTLFDLGDKITCFPYIFHRLKYYVQDRNLGIHFCIISFIYENGG